MTHSQEELDASWRLEGGLDRAEREYAVRAWWAIWAALIGRGQLQVDYGLGRGRVGSFMWATRPAFVWPWTKGSYVGPSVEWAVRFWIWASSFGASFAAGWFAAVRCSGLGI